MQSRYEVEDHDREPVPRRRVHSKRVEKTWPERFELFIDYSDIALYWTANKLAYFMSFGVAFWLWFIGAKFTLIAINELFSFTTTWGLYQWIIPVGISAVEMLFSRRKGWHFYLFLFVSAIDMLTTVYGTLEWAAGRELTFGAGILVPEAGLGLIIPTTIISFVLTFGPEKLAVWALRAILGLDTYEEE